MLYKYSRAIRINGELYGSLNSLHSSSALVHAKPNNMSTGNLVSGFVRKYIIVHALVGNEPKPIYLAKIDWLLEHDYKNWWKFGEIVQPM